MEPYPSVQCKLLSALFTTVRRRTEFTMAAEALLNNAGEGVGSWRVCFWM
jgi:hypothetical protein